jgi:uncharacterized protein with HEPN domain
MRPETLQHLADAKSAAEELRQVAVAGWQQERILALAVERLLTIIGEAFVRMRASEPDVLDQITDAPKIIGMRNVLVHGYDALDPARIQDAIALSVPKLITDIDVLLTGHGRG